MKVLVIEDKAIHQDSARDTLAEHDLTIVFSYAEAMKILRPWPHNENFDFEVVLVDMMMPMSKETLVPEAFNADGQVPYGFVLALMAAHRGAKYVAMVTDTNHHEGAMSAALDNLCPSYYDDLSAKYVTLFTIEGAKVVFVHAPFVYRKGSKAPFEHQMECCSMEGCSEEGKDWGRVLKDLITRSK